MTSQIIDALRPLAVPLESVQQLDGNPRKGDAEAVAASLARFGQRKPIVVRASDRQIIAGNHTWLAAQALGWDEIAAVLVDDDTATSQAFALADNRTAELGGYDEALLLELIKAVGMVDPELLLDTGWDDESIADLVGRADPLPDALPADEASPPPLEPFSKPGDVWLLGEHRVICGDSTSIADAEALMAGELADAVWTDPPYNVAYSTAAGSITNDNLGDSEFAQFLRDAFTTAASVMKDGAAIYVAHADTERLNFTAAFRDAGFKLSGVLIWAKSSFTLSRSDYQWQHEPILYGWKPGAAHRWHGDRKQTTLIDLGTDVVEKLSDRQYRISLPNTTLLVEGSDLIISEMHGTVITENKPPRSADHPTMKPVALVRRMLRNSAKRGGVVLDLFGGSGSTLMAAESLGMRARIIELDPRYVDVICRRWQEHTGSKPILESTGKAHDFTKD